MSNESVTFSSLGDLSRFDVVIYELVERNRSYLWDGIPSDSGTSAEEYGEYGDEDYWEEVVED